MRIAQRTVTRNYLSNLNSTMSNRAEVLRRAASGLKFSKLSQNVSDGVRAMRAQEARIASQAHLATVENLRLEFNAVDSNLESIDSILQLMQEKTLKAMSDSYGEVNRDVLSQEMISARDQILQFVNAKFGDKYLFSGTNNTRAAVEPGADGKLTFNGIPLENIYKENSNFYYTIHDNEFADSSAFDLNQNGEITYNGVAISQIYEDNGSFYYNDVRTTLADSTELTTDSDGVISYAGVPLNQIYEDGGAFYYDDPLNGGAQTPLSTSTGLGVDGDGNITLDNVPLSDIYVGSTFYYDNPPGTPNALTNTNYLNMHSSGTITYDGIPVDQIYEDNGGFYYNDPLNGGAQTEITNNAGLGTDGSGNVTLDGVPLGDIYQGDIYYYDDIAGGGVQTPVPGGAALGLDDNGMITIHGASADLIYEQDGEFLYDINGLKVPDSADVYLDIGLGFSISSVGVIDTRTAFKSSFSALDIFGYGVPDPDGTPNNVYDLLTELASAIDNDDHDGMDRMHTKLVKLTDQMRMSRTELGTRMSFLERTEERLDIEIDNLGEMESKLVSTEMAEESMNISMAEYTWLAVLQLGSQILPTSLMDYLR